MWGAQNEGHSYGMATLAKSRYWGWIIRGQRLADKISKTWPKCNLDRKRRVDQRLGSLDLNHVDYSTLPFTHISVDLAGHMLVKIMVNPRRNMKVWSMLFLCNKTGSVRIGLMVNYSAEYWMFRVVRGNPTSVRSDQGSQNKATVNRIMWEKHDPEIGANVVRAHARFPSEGIILSSFSFFFFLLPSTYFSPRRGLPRKLKFGG